MADRIPPVDGTSCADVRDSLELLAVGALDPGERDDVLAHVAGCPGCRGALDRAEATVASLLRLVPDAEVPEGFADRVVAGTSAAPRTRSARWIGLAVACVVTALLVAAVSAVLGSGGSGDRAEGPSTGGVAPRSAPLVTPTGVDVGSVTIDGGDPATLVMAVDLVLPGVTYDCVVRAAGGELVAVGSWTAGSADDASWSVVLDPALGHVDEVHLVVPGSEPVATARLA